VVVGHWARRHHREGCGATAGRNGQRRGAEVHAREKTWVLHLRHGGLYGEKGVRLPLSPSQVAVMEQIGRKYEEVDRAVRANKAQWLAMLDARSAGRVQRASVASAGDVMQNPDSARVLTYDVVRPAQMVSPTSRVMADWELARGHRRRRTGVDIRLQPGASHDESTS
jgi:hypothetical protein